MALSARACLSGASSDDWFASARACHAEPLALGSSGSSRHWSRSVGWSPAGSALIALGLFLSALVTRTGWYSARPAARATGLAPRWSPLVQRLRSRSFLERACHADRLVPGSSGSLRHWYRSALVSAVWACCTPQSPGGSSAGLVHPSQPLTSSVPLSPPRARIPLEFGCSRQFHTRGCTVLTVPRVR